MNALKHFGKVELLLATLLMAITAGVIIYKVDVLGYTMASVQPEKGYFVRLVMEVEGNGKNAYVDAVLPVQSDRQRIRQEQQASDAFRYSITRDREARWYARDLTDTHRITYSFFAQTEAREYPLPAANTPVPIETRENYQKYLLPSDDIQSDEEDILKLARQLMPPEADFATSIRNAYNYVYQQVTYKKVRGPTDALTARRLSEASCNGKNRLLVALFRARGIPARMAKGLILQNTSKRTTHAWTEVLVDDTWVPLCPTNGHFAEIPEHYLELAKGDQAAFTHTKNIGFDWQWIVQPQLTQPEQAVLSSVSNTQNFLSYWVSLKDFHISLNVIMVILMIPIAATTVCITRNIIGLVPFGTFMPALIAVSFQETGFILGSILFATIILASSFLNFALIRLHLLHVPRLAIILTFVVISLMVVSITAIKLGMTSGAAVSLFPMAIMTLTSERFSQTILEDSWGEAWKRMAITYVVSCACYLVISDSEVRLLVAAFPELLLANIALNLVIGSWSGLRLLELIRFRGINPDNATPTTA
jgi:transglutaminase-like putative cysteine protease